MYPRFRGDDRHMLGRRHFGSLVRFLWRSGLRQAVPTMNTLLDKMNEPVGK